MGGALYKRSTTVYSMERIVLMSIGMTKMEKYSLTGTQNVKEKKWGLKKWRMYTQDASEIIAVLENMDNNISNLLEKK